jgi:diguanylate cyclase (GGDEF)-like protein
MEAEFATLERVDLVESMGRVQKVMDASVASLTSQTRDWAEWTDMYEYVRAPARHAEWVKSNLNGQALETADLSFVDVLNGQGHVVLAVRMPAPAEDWRVPAEVRKQLVQSMQAPGAAARCGLLPSAQSLSLVCASRITRSDHSGDFLGAVLMGRTLDARRLAQWQEQTGFGLRLLSVDEVPAQVSWWKDATPEHRLGRRDMAVLAQPQTNVLYTVLTDVIGQSTRALEVQIPRELFARTQALQARVVEHAMLSSLLVAVLLAVAVHWLLVRRLRAFKSQLQALASEAAWSRRIRVPGNDELGVLACEVNLMLDMIDDQVKDLTAQSMTDTLTGLPNRRAFDMRLALEFGRARRQEHALSLLVVDVDFFKRFNDRYGHPTGDAALRTVAEVLCAACTRAVDLAARMGGEEFAVLLPNTPMDGAVDIATRIQRLLAGKAVPHADSGVDAHLTVSIGVATIHVQDETAHALVERADRALYVAKTQGRNRYACDLPRPVKLKEVA